MARPHSRQSSRGNHEEVILAPPGSPTPWSVEQDIRGIIPIPPSRPPGKDGRLNSTKRRLHATASSNSNYSRENQGDDVDLFARRPTRPNSSLSKYKPLPEITPKDTTNHKERINSSTIGEVAVNLEKLQLVHKKDKNMDRMKTAINRDKLTSNTTNLEEGSNSKTNPTCPKNIIKKRPKELGKTIMLGIKLPKTGERVTCSFDLTDTLFSILKFVEEECGEKLSDLYYLAINMPRKVFSNPNITIKQAGLEDKTVLYLVEKDEI